MDSKQEIKALGETSGFIKELAKRLVKQKKSNGMVVLIVIGVMYVFALFRVFADSTIAAQAAPYMIFFGVVYGVILLALIPKLASKQSKYREALAEVFYISGRGAQELDDEMKRYQVYDQNKGYAITDHYVLNFSDTGRESFNVIKASDVMVAVGSRLFDSPVPGANMQWLDYDGTGSTEKQNRGAKEIYATYSVHFLSFSKELCVKGFKNRIFKIDNLKEEEVYKLLKTFHERFPWALIGGEAADYADKNKKEVAVKVQEAREQYLMGNN